jgi:hypothetical protein
LSYEKNKKFNINNIKIKDMKKIILKTAAVLLVMAGMTIACGKEENNTIVALKGTKWKLAGIVDVRTGVLKELEPKDCEQCYTLEFDTDSTALLQSVSNEGKAYINRIPPVLGTYTERGESGDGQLFVDVLYFITLYTQENNKLKFFYKKDGKNSYLLYKLIQP